MLHNYGLPDNYGYVSSDGRQTKTKPVVRYAQGRGRKRDRREERRGWKIAIGREDGGNLHLAQRVPSISSIPSRYYARGTPE